MAEHADAAGSVRFDRDENHQFVQDCLLDLLDEPERLQEIVTAIMDRLLGPSPEPTLDPTHPADVDPAHEQEEGRPSSLCVGCAHWVYPARDGSGAVEDSAGGRECEAGGRHLPISPPAPRQVRHEPTSAPGGDELAPPTSGTSPAGCDDPASSYTHEAGPPAVPVGGDDPHTSARPARGNRHRHDDDREVPCRDEDGNADGAGAAPVGRSTGDVRRAPSDVHSPYYAMSAPTADRDEDAPDRRGDDGERQASQSAGAHPQPYSAPFQLGDGTAWACLTCAALVVGRGRHDAWHAAAAPATPDAHDNRP